MIYRTRGGRLIIQFLAEVNFLWVAPGIGTPRSWTIAIQVYLFRVCPLPGGLRWIELGWPSWWLGWVQVVGQLKQIHELHGLGVDGRGTGMRYSTLAAPNTPLHPGHRVRGSCDDEVRRDDGPTTSEEPLLDPLPVFSARASTQTPPPREGSRVPVSCSRCRGRSA